MVKLQHRYPRPSQSLSTCSRPLFISTNWSARSSMDVGHVVSKRNRLSSPRLICNFTIFSQPKQWHCHNNKTVRKWDTFLKVSAADTIKIIKAQENVSLPTTCLDSWSHWIRKYGVVGKSLCWRYEQRGVSTLLRNRSVLLAVTA